MAPGHVSPGCHGHAEPAPAALGVPAAPGVSDSPGWAPWGHPRHQGHRHRVPRSHRDLGATTVSLDGLVANPSLPMAVKDNPLLDHRERPTGVSARPTAPHSTPGCRRALSPCHCPSVAVPLQCTVTFRCYYEPHGAAGDVAVPSAHGQVALEPPGVAPAERKEDFQVRHPRARCHPGVTSPGGHRVTATPQVRVRVIKGRQLRGRDIRPVVKVQIGKRQFHTRSRTGNNPYFNEVTPPRGQRDGAWGPPLSLSRPSLSLSWFLGVLPGFPADA